MMVVLECSADECLAMALGVNRRHVIHRRGRGAVASVLRREQGFRAMVDEDPNAEPDPYLRSLVHLETRHGITVLQDSVRGHRVSVLKPRMEEWIATVAAAARIDLTKYGFAHRSGLGLHGEINGRLRSFDRLLGDLVGAGRPEMAFLAGHIR